MNPVYHVLVYCGFQPKHENDRDLSDLKGEVKAGKVAERVAQDKDIAAAKYKLDSFVNDIVASLPAIEGSRDFKQGVMKKLGERIAKREQKEAQWGGLHTFFSRLGHFFRGHGFNTTAERAHLIESKLGGGSVSKKEIANFFKSDEKFLHLGERDNIRDHIAKLSPEKIREYVKEDTFSLKSTMTSTFKDWKQVTDLWNPEQKKSFYSALLGRNDGISLLANAYHSYGNLLDESSVKIKDIDAYIDRAQFIRACIKQYNPSMERGSEFPQWLTEAIFLECMKQNKWDKITPLLQQFNLDLLAQFVTDKSQHAKTLIMTDADLTKLNSGYQPR
jgi:hypothetical protein